MKIDHKSDYSKRRVAEYPSIEDQIGAIFKGGQDFAKMQQEVAAVKEKYPKPIKGTK